jgi:endonuclease/exonuclease/phosphatase (EEP) superfamily protein YafD
MTNQPEADVALLASKVASLPHRDKFPMHDSAEAPEIHARPRSFLWTACWLAAWCTTLALLLVAALRAFYFDREFALIWLNAFSRYVYLPAYLCFAWAAWQRRWLLSIASLAVVCFHVNLMAPDFRRDRRFDTRAPVTSIAAQDTASNSIRIFFANVAVRNTEYAAMLEEIAAEDPDVIVLVEFSWPWQIAFQKSPVMAPYVYGTGHLKSHVNTVNVFSRLPLTTEIQNWVRRRAVHTVDVPLGSKTLRLIGLHAPRPIDGSRFDYKTYWDELLPILTAEQGPLVIIGDFNATEHSQVYERLTGGRLRSAHDDRGRGYATTWPNGQYLCPPIRIDQAFVSPEIEVVRIVEGLGRGSDHKPLIVDVRVRNSAQKKTFDAR